MSSPSPTRPTTSASVCKLPPERISASCARLSTPVPPPKDLGPLHRPHVLPKSTIDGAVDRMYRLAAERRTRNLTTLRDQRDRSEAPKTVQLVSEDLDESVKRLYTQGVNHKRKTHEALARKYLFQPQPVSAAVEAARGGSPSRPQSRLSATAASSGARGDDGPAAAPDGLAATVDRLYVQEQERARRREEERYNKYVAATEPHMLQLPSEDIESIVDRLYKGQK